MQSKNSGNTAFLNRGGLKRVAARVGFLSSAFSYGLFRGAFLCLVLCVAMRPIFAPRSSLPAAVCALALALVGCQVFAKKSEDPKKDKTSKTPPGKPEAGKSKTSPWNEAVLNAVHIMPQGGGYSRGKDAFDALRQAVRWGEEDKPEILAKAARPAFCSGATYVVLLIALAQEQFQGRISLIPDVWRQLMIEDQQDGEGAWGRWNANGPGTARLFYETGAGRNFTAWEEAKAGDFLKIFWNDSIGASEKGHSVIFLGMETGDGEEKVSYWSSNEPDGYSVKTIPRSKIQRAIFSRLETPNKLAALLKLPKVDPLLAGLVERTISPEDAAKAIGISKW